MEKVERFKKAYEHLKSLGKVHMQKDVASVMKVSESNISAAFKGNERFLTNKFLMRFNKAFGDLFNNKWLTDEEGEMLVQQTEEEKEEKVSINIANLTKLAGMPNIVDIPEHLEAPKIKSINIVEGFSEKLVKLGYEKPVDEKGYKVIALDLADRLNRMASMSEDMVGIVSKPLLDRIGLVDKQRILAESRVAELEAKIAAMEIKAAK